MAVHFSVEELAARRRAACDAMAALDLDGLLLFKQESMYYLTGYDTFGFCFFQCLYLGADGRVALLTRAPDLRQAQQTSVVEDIRIWIDGAGRNPAEDLRALLEELGLRGRRLGVELDTYGLTAASWRKVEAALAGFVALEDASDLVNALRLVKSEAELDYVRLAAALADDALEEAIRLTGPGVYEGDILAAMQGAVFRGGGDYPGNEFIIGSGEGALLCRYFTGRRHLEAEDQLTLEHAGAYRHYHCALMRTLLVGTAHPEHVAMHGACREALDACVDAVRPGRPMGEVYAAHARTLDRAGYRGHRMNACGYSLGATFTPTWMDRFMFYEDNPLEMQPGMVFFLHMILMNSDSGRAMTIGQTVIVTETGHEPLTRLPLDLVVK